MSNPFGFYILVVLAVLLPFSAWSKESCIPAREIIPYPDDFQIGNYQRVHPDGAYVLHSSMQNKVSVVLMDLTAIGPDGKKLARPVATPMNDEVYPATNDWSLFSSPGHDDGMHYYGLNGLLKNGKFDKPIFIDATHNQFYQSVGELPGSTKTKKKIRVTLLSDQKTKEYDLNISNGNVVSGTPSKQGQVCQNIIRDPNYKPDPVVIAAAKIRLMELQPILEELRKRQKQTRDRAERGNIEDQLDNLQGERRQLKDKIENGGKIGAMSMPVLSPDGMELAADVQTIQEGRSTSGTQRIYKINPDYSCDLVDDLKFSTGKVQFSYPQNGKKGSIAFQGPARVNGKQIDSAVAVYDRDQKKTKILYSSGGPTGYPGFTRDGRVIFPACAESEYVDEKVSSENVIPRRKRIDPDLGVENDDVLKTNPEWGIGIYGNGGIGYNGRFPVLQKDGSITAGPIEWEDTEFPDNESNPRPITPVETIERKLERELRDVDKLRRWRESIPPYETTSAQMSDRSYHVVGDPVGPFGRIGVLTRRDQKKARKIATKCGAVIVDPNQINDDGTVNETATKCLSRSGKLIRRNGTSGSELKTKDQQKIVK